MILEHGTILQGGKYTIEKALGQGSFGITYLATTKVKGPLGDISVKVAIKEFFSKELNKRGEDGTVCDSTSGSLAGRYSKMFLREANNLASLEHPGIVNVLESFSENNTHYYVMEYLEGGSLDDYILSKGHLSETESLEYIRQIGSALSYMHSRNMLHLDLKPKNIMLRSDGCLSIIDFGLSKQYESSGEPESSTTIGLGTPGYAPLEQGSEDDRRVFAATLDVYALGATMYKMLTGKTPPRASDVMNDGLPVSDLKKYGVSEDTIASIEKAMAPPKRKRYQSVDDFISSFHSIGKNIDCLKEVENNGTDEEMTEKRTIVNNKSDSSYTNQIKSYDSEETGKINQTKPVLSRWIVVFTSIVIILIVSILSVRKCSSGLDEEIILNDEVVLDSIPDNSDKVQANDRKIESVDKQDKHNIVQKKKSPLPKDNKDVGVSHTTEKTEQVTYHVDKTSVSIYNGQRENIRLYDNYGNEVIEGVEYVSDNSMIADCKDGVVIAKGIGETRIYVKYNGIGYYCDVKVVTPPGGLTEEQKKEMEDDQFFYVCEKMPEFQGGDVNDFHRWLMNNINYPELARENGITGRVVASFVIDTDGSVINVSIVKGVDPLLDNEVVRIISASPKWTPGIQGDKYVKVHYSVPVVFSLS